MQKSKFDGNTDKFGGKCQIVFDSAEPAEPSFSKSVKFSAFQYIAVQCSTVQLNSLKLNEEL